MAGCVCVAIRDPDWRWSRSSFHLAIQGSQESVSRPGQQGNHRGTRVVMGWQGRLMIQEGDDVSMASRASIKAEHSLGPPM